MRQVIADRFELERLVGSGGMGEVFRARDRISGELVAVKVLHASLTRDVDRFRREAQMLSNILHPRIVKYVAHGLASGNRPFLAMEWLEGEDLAERLARAGLSLAESITLARRVSEALAVLHERGIVHRDIKPSNLFLPARHVDQVKVLDLGVARSIHASRPSTRSGVMVGTPGYMAPEQARGAKTMDARADIFSLGCVLYECLVGAPAFVGDNVAALLAKILLEKAPSVRDPCPDLPPALDDLVERMLSKHASGRPADGSAMLRELERFASIKEGPAQRASVPVQRALTGSERRLVSVVMAAFADGAAMADGPLGAFETVEATFDPRAIVASYDAEAELLADGSIVVTLAGKGSAGDQAAQAARCALALRSHLLTAQIALATGLATVTQRSCVGEVIDRAAALLTMARGRTTQASDETKDGETPIFLDETTAGLLDARFDVGGDERGLFIRGLRQRGVNPRTLLGKPTPFVGRDREVATLVGIFEECVYEPVARAVLVTGQAGAGKSRITTEFLRKIRSTNEVEIWLARGDPMSEGSPFGLLGRLIRGGSGAISGDPLVVRQQKLKARVRRHVGEADAQRISEFLGEIASVPFPDRDSVQLRAARNDSTLMGDQMRRAFADVVVAECSATPLVLVLEDLHWGDLPSVSFVDSALRAAAERPFMVVGVARPEIHDVFPRLWGERSLQEIRLGPLVRRAGERLLREVLGPDLPADDVARLLDRAAGNALYLEELIRAYAEDVSREASPPSQPTGAPLSEAPSDWSLPTTVLAMVQTRIERLDPMARRVLRAASIFGEVFWRGGLTALIGAECKAAEIEEWLAELRRREIVERRDGSRFPADTEYVFRHALVRDAAYHMLTAEDLVLGHRLAAEWLESAGEDEAIVLGEHFERGGVAERARTFYARAAEQALEGNDFGAARSRAELAIRAGAAGEQRGRLRLLLAEACRWSGDQEHARKNARAAMDELPTSSPDWFSALAEATEATLALGRLEEARELAKSIADDVDAPMSRPRVIAMSRIAVGILLAGSFDIATALLERIEREAEALVASEPAARAFFVAARGSHARWFGDLERAATLAQEAVGCFALVGDVRNVVLQRNVAGFALLQLGAFHAADSLLSQALADAERLGLSAVTNETRLHLAQLHGRSQREGEALALLKQALAGFVAHGDRLGEGRARAYLAGVLHLTDKFADAEREALRALTLLEASPPYRASLLGLLAITRADAGDAEGSFSAGCDAMADLERVGGTLEGEAFVRLGYAEGLRAKGDVAGSKAAISSARDRLLACAGRIKNGDWRRFFVERLREHSRILVRAGEWLV